MVNLKLAFRTLAKSPFVTGVAVVSLALGIGANAAIFSMFDELLLQPLPVHEPDRLVNLGAPGVKNGSTSCGQAGNCDLVFSYPMFRDLERSRQSVFAGIAAHRSQGANLAFRGNTMSGEVMLVSGSYFPLLGIAPALGRLLGPADDQTVGANYLAVLSYAYWENQLGAARDVVGQTIIINGHPMTIVGVAPRGFSGTTLGQQPQAFVPLSMRGVVVPGFRGMDDRRNYWAYLFARLKPGVSIAQAKSAINGVYKPIVTEVEAPLQQGMSARTLEKFKSKEITVEEGRRGQSSLHREASTPLALLLGVTGIVLLIACANIANLLLARGANRAMEMAVRLSLGAGRAQLLAQLLAESCLLALAGGAASLFVARWTLSGILAVMPEGPATTIHPQLRLPVVLFAAALSLATGFLFGLFPALHSTRPDLMTAIRASTGQPSGSRTAARFRTSLVTVQIALSTALLISAGLFIKSLQNVSRVDLGIKIDNIITFGISPELNGYSHARSAALFTRVEEELAAIPGVTGVTASMVPLLAGSNWGSSVNVEGFKRDPDTDTEARFNEVGPGYFRTLGVALLAGREFTASDVVGAPKVVVVNETFTKKFKLGREAVGRHMSSGSDSLDLLIVGVVADAKYADVKDPVPPLFYTPYRQDSTVGSIAFYARTGSDAQRLLRAVPPVLKRLDPSLPVEQLKTLPQQVRDNVFLDRMISMLAVTFAVLATLLAAVGLYGVLAYTVAQRTREIGVRMALGADGARVRGMMLRYVGVLTLVGGSAGVVAALFIGQKAGSLLYGLKGYDPVVFVASTAVLALVAFAAGYVPALRASRVDPMRALRYE